MLSTSGCNSFNQLISSLNVYSCDYSTTRISPNFPSERDLLPKSLQRTDSSSLRSRRLKRCQIPGSLSDHWVARLKQHGLRLHILAATSAPHPIATSSTSLIIGLWTLQRASREKVSSVEALDERVEAGSLASRCRACVAAQEAS